MLGKVFFYTQRLPDVYLMYDEDAARVHFEGEQISRARFVHHAREQAAILAGYARGTHLLELGNVEFVE
ncbi:hypothetical protein HMPREF0762_00471 [Slackia exigua ATCC 700122]|uniref:Uncharacterized protein n=1 Tax=Slackia exigua (strain ATCC 700122 / DSM 15923 / CIP 105133 / JCM 11022 / KCTC 5966 / S-7) TaxID=649764 RepID=D0WFF3_SLAES|nr:hypothetical protein HMPREF0762_00471 [Slackia exigua ATCC 700122]